MESSELKNIRLELGLKQAEFARLLNTPYQTYSKWERGTRRIPGILDVALKTVLLEKESDR